MLTLLTFSQVYEQVDEYCRIADSTAMEYLKRQVAWIVISTEREISFAHAVCEAFGEDYLRGPTPEEIKKYTEDNAQQGWPGLFGALDCTYWAWDKCPYSLQGDMCPDTF